MDKNIVELSANTSWEGSTKIKVQIGEFSPFYFDEPKEAGGSDSAPNPLEFTLAALGGCSSIVIRGIAKELGLKVNKIDAKISGKVDLRGEKGVENVSTHFLEIKEDVFLDIEGTEDQYVKLRQEVDRRCPMINLIKDAKIPLQMNWY